MQLCSLPKRTVFIIIFLLPALAVFSQRYLSDYDSALFMRDTVRPLATRFANISISGYIQPQFQVAQSKGAHTYEGGDFQPYSNNRFMLKRARMKFDYLLRSKESDFPKALFAFQIEATERDVNVRDMFLKVYEPKKSNFSLTAGLFARPFGYEVNLSSSFRETPERGRASQTLMPSERDLGVMVSYERQKRRGNHALIKYDIGLFNSEGKAGPAEFDSYKDLISRLSLKPISISTLLSVSGGLSYFNGGWVEVSRYRYTMAEANGAKYFDVDSSGSNIGKKAPKKFYGADVQLINKNSWGKTELRAEYWNGTTPGTSNSTTNPGVLPTGPTYIRNFDAAFFYLLQNIVNSKWELVAKYDWYDPNLKAKGREIGMTNLSGGDIKFSTFGFGLTRYFYSGTLKLLAYYAIVRNELTTLPGFTSDAKDDVFTLRMQLRF